MAHAFNLLEQRLPPGSTREARIALLVEAAHALCNGEPVTPSAALVLGPALLAWLRDGGKLEQRLGVNRRGSHLSVPKVAARLIVDAADGHANSVSVLRLSSSSMSDTAENFDETESP